MSFDRLILLIGAFTAFIGTAVAPVVIKIIENHTKRLAEDKPIQPQFGMTVDNDRADELADQYIADLKSRATALDVEVHDLSVRLNKANTLLARNNLETF